MQIFGQFHTAQHAAAGKCMGADTGYAFRLPDLPQPFTACKGAHADFCHSLRECDRRQKVPVLKRPFPDLRDAAGKPQPGNIPCTLPEHAILVRLKTVQTVHHSLFCQRRQFAPTVCQACKMHDHAVRQRHLPQVDAVAERIFSYLHKTCAPKSGSL